MREFNLTVRGHLRTGLSRRVPEESVPRLWPGALRRRQKSPILNTKLVGGPGFEPGASRSRTVSVPCPPVSDRLPRRPREYEIDQAGVLWCPPRAVRCRECVIRL